MSTLPPPKHARPPRDWRQLGGIVLALVLAGLWLVYELQGDPVPSALGQGLVAALALIAGAGKLGGGSA